MAASAMHIINQPTSTDAAMDYGPHELMFAALPRNKNRNKCAAAFMQNFA